MQANPSIRNILIAGLIAGILDGLAAVVLLAKMNFSGVFKYIASGLFGNNAFVGGSNMVIYGICLHLFIGIAFAFFYAFVFRKIRFLNTNNILNGLLYGVFIWMVMNLLVLPLSKVPQSPITLLGAIKGMAILMVAVGLPFGLLLNQK